VSMVDRNLGEVMDALRELGLEENTVVFFTGDNGGQDRFKSDDHPRGFFGPNVNPETGAEFRGGKRLLYEGGLRIPFLVRWPGHIESGSVSDLLCYQPDILPTLAELTGASTPDAVDGVSIAPTLLGQPQDLNRKLYWEYQGQVAARKNHWKAIRPKPEAAWELYNLDNDISESNDIANDHPNILAELKAFAKKSREPARPGAFSDRTRHERDRQAKWGFSRDD